MVLDLRGVRAMLLPGTGSDDDYLRRAFTEALSDAGIVVLAAVPEPRAVVAGYERALDAAAAEGPILVGGVSLGAAVATTWAIDHPGRTLGVLAALPPWTGAPAEAPASLSARHTAATLRRDGLDATTAAMRASSPNWLAEELTRSWTRQWPDLPDAMEHAAAYVAPTRAQLGRLSVPMGVVGGVDDPIHPIAVAREWAATAPHASLRTLTFDQFGPHPPTLGSACLEALLTAQRSAGS